MTRTFVHESLFDVTPSGILVPSGEASSFTSKSKSTYLFVKARALDLKGFFAEHGLQLDRSPSLAKMLADCIELSDRWFLNSGEGSSFQSLLSAAQMLRLTSVILPLRGTPVASRVLVDLLDGSLDLLNRARSKAKDILWEVELCQTLVANGLEARLAEPDIVITLGGHLVGIACKKFYSESNVSKVLSQAVSQIERHVEFGLVAVNLDDLLPADVLLTAPTIDAMAGVLQDRNIAFLHAHERHFRRYLTPGRAMAALVSCGAIADVKVADQRFMNARQSIVWQLPNIPAEKERQMSRILAGFHTAERSGG